MLASGQTETTSYTYDGLGNLLSETTSETISSETRTNTNRYDAKGRLTGSLSGVGSAELAALGGSPTQTQIDNVYNNYGVRYVYDASDYLIAKIDPNGDNGAGNKTLYFYNSDGDLVLEINALGETSEHRYAVLGDKSGVLTYGTRLTAATMTGWTGGLLTSAATNAVAAIANVAIDSHQQFAYNNDGTLQQVVDPLGNVQSYSYNSFDELVSSTATVDVGLSRLTTYSYNRRGKLLSETADAGVGGFALVTSYGYDSFGRSISATDAKGNIRLSDYNRGHWLKSSTDAFGLLTQFQYDARGNVTRSTDRANLHTYFTYDAFNRTIATITPENLTSTVKRNAYGQTIEIKDAANRVTAYTYDKSGNLKTVTQTPVAGTDLVTTNAYDKAGRLQQTTDARGVITRYTYDAANRVLTRVEDHGSGKLNLTTTYTYDAKGQQMSMTDAAGTVSTFTYDLSGRQLQVVQDAGAGKLNITTDYAYRADGKIISMTEAFGTSAAVSTTYEYDVLGRITKQSIDPAGINETTRWRYDANGNVVAQTDTLGRTTRYVYDAENREIFSVNAEGGVVATGYDVEGRAVWKKQFATRIAQSVVDGWDAASLWQLTDAQAATSIDLNNDRITRTLYDKDGRLAYTVDPEGYVTENRYDAANNIIKSVRYAVAVSVDDTVTKVNLAALLPSSPPGSAAQTNYTYDNANRLTDISDPLGIVRHFVLNETGQIRFEYTAYGSVDEVTTYREYDKLGRMTSETRGTGTLEAATTLYGYDAMGRINSITDARGYVTTRTFDALGRMLTETVPLDSTSSAVTTRQYGARGNMVKLTDPRGNVGYFYYDNMDRLTLQVDPEGYATKTTYGIDDNVASVKRYYLKATGLGNVEVQPTLTDHAKDATTSFTRDRLNRLTATTDAEGFSETYTLDAHGNRIQVTNKLGGVTDNLFDQRGLLLSETLPETTSWTDGLPRRIVNTYAYDARGNRKEMVEAFGLAEARATYFEYDKLDRLVQKTGGSVETVGNNLLSLPDAQPKEVTVYDRRSNVKGKADANGNITIFYYDALDRKIAELDPAGTLKIFTYDDNGNVISERVYADSITTLPNDPNGQTAQVYRLFDIAYGGMPSNAQVAEWVGKMNTLYQNFVQPTAENWPAINPFEGKLNMVQGIAGELLADPAVQLRLSATDDALFVSQIFQHAYRRTPSASETTTWTANLAAGWTRAGMLTHFSENLEHRNIAARLSLTEAAKRDQPSPINALAYRETLFAYDRNNQLVSTTRENARTGSFSGSAYSSSLGNIGTQIVYDSMGNAVQEIDGNGSSIYHYYDNRGVEVARVDQDNYLTTFERDSEGNVTAERRYATQVAGAPTSATIPTVATNANDRVTTFVYDRNGRRTQLVRSGITGIMDGATGNITAGPVSATITYTYNGLGLVTSKVEANGDQTGYSYDVMGRQVQVTGTAFTDQNGAAVAPVSVNMYDGLSNLVKSVENGTRTTTLTYGAGGRLASVKDSAGFSRGYTYDLGGRVMREKYDRGRGSTGLSGVTEGKYYRYDAAGRVTMEGMATKVVNDWIFGDTNTSYTYTAFGDVATKALNGVVQESNFYDRQGRLEKSTSGDGVWRFYAHDGNGNVTATLTAIATDLTDWSKENAIKYMSNGIPPFGWTGNDPNDPIYDNFSVMLPNIVQAATTAVFTIYDKRNMALATVEPNRTISNGVNSTVQQTLIRSRTHNAFGEVASETSARGFTTDYAYNVLGRLTSKQGALVSATLEDGSTVSIRPTESYHYDIAGRMTGITGTNGYTTRRTLLAGTGHDNPDNAKVVSEYRPDSSVWTTGYDVFGDARKVTDGLGRITLQSFDGMGRVTQIVRPMVGSNQLTETFVYDGLGQRIKHWNSKHGSSTIETTDYDATGRVISTINYAGDEVTTSYAWNGSLATNGLGTFGGWVKTTSTISDRYSTSDSIVAATETTDSFGRMIARSDMGAYHYQMSFNRAGQQTGEEKRSQFNNLLVQATANSYFNTGQLAMTSVGGIAAVNTDWTRLVTNLAYDADGNRTYERLARDTGDYTPAYQIWNAQDQSWDFYEESYTESSTLLADGRATYDALGRMATYTDWDLNGIANASLSWAYDAASNVRRVYAAYKAMGANGSLATYDSAQDYWYKYDALNRMVTTKGVFNGSPGSGYISRGGEGSDIAYDAAGQRATVTTGYTPKLETYGYNAAGYLTSVTISVGGGTTRTRATYSRDLLGRVTDYIEYDNAGTLVHARGDVEYNKRDQVLLEKTRTKQGSDWIYTHTVNYYTATGEAMAQPANISHSAQAGTSSGTVLAFSETKHWKNGSTNPVYGAPGSYSQADLDYADAYVTNGYSWTDQAVQLSVQYVNRDGTTNASYQYDANGSLTYVDQTGGTRPRDISFTTDAVGHVLERTENDNNYSQSDPRARHYRFNGIDMGTIGNNGSDNIDYDASIIERTAAAPTSPGAFRGGATTGTPYADFDMAYDAVNGTSEAPVASYYTVRQGDTLATIAQTVWGDASLWYMLAEANGLSGNGAIAPGIGLIIPEKGSNFHNSADTFRPYDPQAAIGDTQPGAAKPPKKSNKCGVFGQILLVAIAVAVSIALPGGGTFIGAAINGAIGSAVSQAFGVATGIQSKFSFKSVALAALTAGVGSGVGSVVKLGTAATSSAFSKVAGDVLRGALTSAATQGVAVATGLQKKFSWTSVAVGGVVGGMVGVANRTLAGAGIGLSAAAIDNATPRNLGFYANQTLSGVAGAVAGGATRSLLNGSDFGDNVLAALPDVLGATFGNAIGDGINGRTFGPAGNKAVSDTATLTQGAIETPERKYWGIAKPPSNIQYMGGEPVGQSSSMQSGGSGLTSYDGAPLQPMTDPDQPMIVVTGQRPNTGQSIFSQLGNIASNAINYDIYQGVSLNDAFSAVDRRVRHIVSSLPPARELGGRLLMSLDYGLNSPIGIHQALNASSRNANARANGFIDGGKGLIRSLEFAANVFGPGYGPAALRDRALLAEGTTAVFKRVSESPLGVGQLGVDLAVAGRNEYNRYQALDPAGKSEYLNYAAGAVQFEGLATLATAGGGAGLQAMRGSGAAVRVVETGGDILLRRGVANAGLRQGILDTGFNPAILDSASPITLARFDKLFQGTFDAGKSFRGRLGNLSTRVSTIETAAGIDKLGLIPDFESLVRLGGGRARFVDVAGLNPTGSPAQYFQLYRDAAGGTIPVREINAANDIFRATGVRPVMVRTGP